MKITPFAIGWTLLCFGCFAEEPMADGRMKSSAGEAKSAEKSICAASYRVVFTPPKDWKLAEASTLPPRVQAMVIGKGKGAFPPSINLSMEEFNGSVRDYLKIIKTINASKGSDWKELGTIKTAAGDASMSQTESLTEWGEVRMMHLILSKGGMVYILTASSLKDEFPEFYKTFFQSLRSLRFEQISAADEGNDGKAQGKVEAPVCGTMQASGSQSILDAKMIAENGVL